MGVSSSATVSASNRHSCPCTPKVFSVISHCAAAGVCDERENNLILRLCLVATAVWRIESCAPSKAKDCVPEGLPWAPTVAALGVYACTADRSVSSGLRWQPEHDTFFFEPFAMRCDYESSSSKPPSLTRNMTQWSCAVTNQAKSTPCSMTVPLMCCAYSNFFAAPCKTGNCLVGKFPGDDRDSSVVPSMHLFVVASILFHRAGAR
jgi:hypothetical protein